MFMRLVLAVTLLAQFGNAPLPTVFPLHQATALGRVQAVKLFLAAGMNAKERDSDGLLPIEIALARAERLKDAASFALNALLLRATAGIDGKDPQGWTPLHHAIVSDDAKLVQELIKHGADVLKGRGQNAFDVAKLMKSEAMLLRAVIEEDKLPERTVYQINKHRLRPVVEEMLAEALGLPPTARTQLARTVTDANALWQAIRANPQDWATPRVWNYVRVVKTAKHFEHLDLQGFPHELVREQLYYDGHFSCSALHVAARHGDLELFRYLHEEMGLPIDHEVFIEIAIGGHVNIVRYLLSRETEITHANAEEVGGFTLLHYAAWHGNLAMIELLVELGADVNAPASHYGYKVTHISPLQAAAISDDNLLGVQFLVEKGAKIDYSSRTDHHNPLHQTVLEWARKRNWQGRGEQRDGRVWEYLYAKGLEQGKFVHDAVNALRVDDVKLLVAQGIDVNTQDHRGFTPLLVAAGYYQGYQSHLDDDEARLRTAIAEILIASGAEVNLGGANDWQPLPKAIENKNFAMVDLFLANGADIAALHGRARQDALQLAQAQHNEDNSDVTHRIVELLKNHITQH